MCFNCGCKIPDDDMGHADNITLKTFEKAAAAEGQTVEEAMENAYELLGEQLHKDHDDEEDAGDEEDDDEEL